VSVSVGGELDFGIARYHADGTLDQSFGGDGKALVDFGANDVLRDMAIQSDSKIVAVGSTTGGAALARLNPDGSLDTQGLDLYMDAPFGTGGNVVDGGAGGSLSSVSTASSSRSEAATPPPVAASVSLSPAATSTGVSTRVSERAGWW